MDLRFKKTLLKINYKGVDIGSAVLSTFISWSRESNPDFNINRKKIDSMLDAMVNLCDDVELKLKTVKPDLVYFFNGRFSLYRPI